MGNKLHHQWRNEMSDVGTCRNNDVGKGKTHLETIWVNKQSVHWAKEAEFTANKVKSWFFAPNLAQTDNHDQLCF